jgi:thiamine pyrophosphokinase
MSYALIILKGDTPSIQLLESHWQEAALVICADGAASALLTYGKTPDIIIGDMDSITDCQLERFKTTKIMKVEDQDTTDGEKALNYCLRQNIRKASLLGGFGNRIDHSIYTIELIKKFHKKGLAITSFTESEKLYLINQTTSLKEKPGTRISIFPIFGDVNNISLQGFDYDLQHANFKFGEFSSISNRIKHSPATIRFSIGELLVISGY